MQTRSNINDANLRCFIHTYIYIYIYIIFNVYCWYWALITPDIILILLRIKSNCVFIKLYISYLHWLALKFVSIFCISVILSTPNHDFVPKEFVSVSTKVRFGTQRVRFGIHISPFRSVPVRFGPFRSVSVRFGVH